MLVGEKFANTILANGGSKPSMETFKEFRGREPKVDALLEHSGLLDSLPTAGEELANGVKVCGKAVGRTLHKCIIPLTVLAFCVDYF